MSRRLQFLGILQIGEVVAYAYKLSNRDDSLQFKEGGIGHS
jgi:hypothetical protein